ncbi:hypothetical protein GRI97_10020 [Altererythrobacter xixiisoli]|uniref:Uncharacterized protein n=1 Tax=Croceibacterium xixiisoli TaxID=1476466 RepID=A0A6I4TT39_9SPHN|nr:hypothetical protein [Croceibacterium xixiisoli]MXO99325.1 hypothetical protein [Croceibacterium xixiisoli]
MLKCRYMLPLIALLYPPTLAAAADRTGIDYGCDTAPGHFSELVLPAPAGDFVVSGEVELGGITQHEHFLSLTRLGIAQRGEPGTSPSDVAGFSLGALADPERRNRLIQGLGWEESANGRDVEHPIATVLRDGGKTAFTLTFQAGTVTLRMAGLEQRIALNAPTPAVRIGCSGADFRYSNLTIAPIG